MLALLVALVLGQCGPQGCPVGAQCPPQPSWKAGWFQAPQYARPQTQPQQQAQPQRQTPRPAIVRIVNVVSVGGRETHNLVSGVVVDCDGSRAMVLTCWHLLDDGAGVITVHCNGAAYAATVVVFDKTWDVALLEIKDPGVKPYPIAEAPPQPGESVVVCGFGPGAYATSGGRITQYVSPGELKPAVYEMIEASGAVRDGDSGGPVLSPGGYVVAILSGQGNNNGRVFVGTCCWRIRRILADFLPRFRRPQPPLVPVPRPVPVPVPDVKPQPSLVGPAGPKGDTGPAGPKGDKGERGEPGPAATPVDVRPLVADIEALKSQLNKPFRVRLLDVNGKDVQQPVEVRLGGELRLRLVPVHGK